MDSTGLLAVVAHVYDLAVALMLAAVCVCVGNAICERFRVRLASLGEEIGFSLFVGAGVIGLSVLLFGLAGWLRPLPIALLMLVFIVVTNGSWTRLYRRSVESLDQSREERVVASIYVVFIAFLVLRAATVPNAPDELIYHLSVTNDFVKHGRVYPMFDNSLGNFPFLIHMVYAAGKLAGSEIAAVCFIPRLKPASSAEIHNHPRSPVWR
jgi:hypothetical protein